VLRKAGLVSRRVDGQRRLYAVEAQAVRGIADWTEYWRQFWESRLDRLEEALEKEARRK
jgi:DNA-binding transcriptional ArsR family regulator